MDDLALNGYDPYALDFLGYGESDRYPQMTGSLQQDASYSKGTAVAHDIDKAVEYILKRTGARKLYLVGHSWGATVAAYYASQHPDRIIRLILFAPFAARREAPIATFPPAYHELTPDQRVEQFASAVPAGENPVLEPAIYAEWKTHWLRSDAAATTRTPASVRFPAGWEIDLNACLQGTCYYDPAKLTIPVLLIRGEWDMLPSAEDAEGMFRAMKNAPLKKYVVIERGTHVMHLEKSRFQLYREVRNFFREDTDATPVQNTKPVAVIFEVVPTPGRKQAYLDIAASLRSELAKIDGFVSIERFVSLQNPDKILSLSFWRDEQAVKQWRNTSEHRLAQSAGRKGIFSDYRLRVFG